MRVGLLAFFALMLPFNNMSVYADETGPIGAGEIIDSPIENTNENTSTQGTTTASSGISNTPSVKTASEPAVTADSGTGAQSVTAPPAAATSNSGTQQSATEPTATSGSGTQPANAPVATSTSETSAQPVSAPPVTSSSGTGAQSATAPPATATSSSGTNAQPVNAPVATSTSETSAQPVSAPPVTSSITIGAGTGVGTGAGTGTGTGSVSTSTGSSSSGVSGPGGLVSGGSSGQSSSGGPGAAMGPGATGSGNTASGVPPIAGNSNTGAGTSDFIPSSGGHRSDLHIVVHSGIENGSDVLLPEGYYFNNVGTYTYEMLEQDLQTLKNNYPAMQMDSLGTTVDGRSLYHVIVGNPNATYKVLVHATIHAREYIVSQLVMREIASLLEMQKNSHFYDGTAISTFLETTCIHFIPMVNPDGATIAQSGMQNVRSEEVKQGLLQMAQWDGWQPDMRFFRNFKANARGTNLNRNFDANWALADPAPGHPHIAAYKGTGVECEVETKALGDLTRLYMFDRTISYHTQGKVLYYNFEMSEACRDETLKLALIAVKNTGYEVLDDYSLNNACGYKDWVQYKLDIPSITIECGKGSHPLPEEQIEEMWQQNRGILPDLLSSIYNHG